MAVQRQRTRRRRKGEGRGPRLSVLSVNNSIVECQLECSRQKTVTFQFDSDDAVFTDIANNLVSADQ